MKKSKITSYYDNLSVEENAAANGVAPSTIRRYIRLQNIDRRGDNRRLVLQEIEKYRTAHPHDKAPKIALALGISPGTVRAALSQLSAVSGQQSAVSGQPYKDAPAPYPLSVSDNQYKILKAIIAIHLPQQATFQCDLTAWTCSFYKCGIPRPNWLFDKYPQLPDVRPLDSLFSFGIFDGFFSSVVIDLPTRIFDPTSKKRLNPAAAFPSVQEMEQENEKMLVLASRILQTHGILVFKTMDLTYRNAPVWISDYVIAKAKELRFALIDKFVFIDPNAAKIDRRRTRFAAAVPAHAFFLVFRKLPAQSKN